jgi:hypothetical protein
MYSREIPRAAAHPTLKLGRQTGFPAIQPQTNAPAGASK